MKIIKLKKQRERIRWGILIVLVCLAGFTYSCSPSQDGVSTLQLMESESTSFQSEESDSANFGTEAGLSQHNVETEESVIYVHVTGYVKNPGVYTLDSQGRIYQAIEAAGGFKKKADQTALNMAEKVVDGQKIYVPSKEEQNETADGNEQNGTQQAFSNDMTTYVTPASNLSGENSTTVQSETGQQGKININTASKDELMTLSGIGETKAEAIIAYRNSQGEFGQIEDLMLVDGIKEGSFSRVKEYICVE